jgi:hypothetical protein
VCHKELVGSDSELDAVKPTDLGTKDKKPSFPRTVLDLGGVHDLGDNESPLCGLPQDLPTAPKVSCVNRLPWGTSDLAAKNNRTESLRHDAVDHGVCAPIGLFLKVLEFLAKIIWQ